MLSLIHRSLVITVVLLAASLGIFAQPSAASMPGEMFASESLKYEGKLNKVLRGISVAELTFTATSAPNSNDIVFRSEAVSKGTLLKIFRFSFLQQYESTVDLTNFNIIKTTKHDVQKQRVRDSEALFDYRTKRVTYVETDPKDRMRPPRRIASEIGGAMHDMVSGIYYLRLQPLAVGMKFEMSVSDSGLVYKVPVFVTSREQQKTILGNVWCFRIEPQIFGKDRLIEQKGKIVIWMTDDTRRIPVRSEIDSEFGKINIKLKSITKTG